MNPFARNEAFEAWIAPARARPQLWRLGLGGAATLVFMLAGGVALGLAALALDLPQAELTEAMMMNTVPGALAALASFGLWWVGLWLALRLVHRRRLASLIAPDGRIDRRRFALGAAIALAFALLSALTALAVGGEIAPAGRPPLAWAATALVALPLIFLQTGAEELIFRGYLTQQLAARFRSPLIWAVAPSLLFGALHWNPLGYGGAVWEVMASTALTGLILTMATVWSGGLSLAMGLHFGLNAFAFLLVSPPGFGAGLSLASWAGGLAEMERLVWVDVVWVAAATLAAAWVFSRSPRGG